MPIPIRLPETAQALYAELLDQHVIAAAESAARGLPPPGSLVSKMVKGNRYWYLQRSEGGLRSQVYLGPETPILRSWMERVREARSDVAPDRSRRQDLVRMLRTAGATVPDAPTGRVIQVLGERGLFRSGAVLIGTHAFGCYGNMLGVRLAHRSVRTADVDLLHDPRIALALDPAAERLELPEALRDADPDFLAVPPLDPRDPSTSFKVRGRELRVDFLTPATARTGSVTLIPRLGIAAQPLPHLGYLLDGTSQAVVLYDEGVLVNVADPARFALHKLWLATDRPAARQTKARKDRLQATTLVEILEEDRHRDLIVAWQDLPRTLRGPVRRELEKAGLQRLVAVD
jgi:hypothetical protein